MYLRQHCAFSMSTTILVKAKNWKSFMHAFLTILGVQLRMNSYWSTRKKLNLSLPPSLDDDSSAPLTSNFHRICKRGSYMTSRVHRFRKRCIALPTRPISVIGNNLSAVQQYHAVWPSI